MELLPGTVLDGTVRSITSFGAFVNLPGGKSGLVHISEIANTYVSDVRQHLTEGQSVRVKVLNIDDRGRINLSVKQAASPASEPLPKTAAKEKLQRTESGSFEDKLRRFMADSDSKIAGVRQYEHKTRSRKR